MSMHDFKSLSYNNIISIENLLQAWSIFKRDKKNKLDVLEFEFNLFSFQMIKTT
jgi:hypothetical protein